MIRATAVLLAALLAFGGCAGLIGSAPQRDDGMGYSQEEAPRWRGTPGRFSSSYGARSGRGELDAIDPAEGRPAPGYETAYSASPNLKPPTRRKYKKGNRATRDDFVDEGSGEGSLWSSSGQTNYYFTKNKVRNVGDILTLTIEQDLVRDVVMEVRRSLTPKEKLTELTLAQERIRRKTLGIEVEEEKESAPSKEAKDKSKKDQLATSAAAPARAAAQAAKKTEIKVDAKEEEKKKEEIIIPKATVGDIDVSKSLELKVGDTMLVEVVQRFPNGNYKIRGTKKIPYRAAYRVLKLTAIVKGADVGDDDLITSGKLYEHRYEVIR